MPSDRPAYDYLPADRELRAAIEEHTGPILSSTPIRAGFNSPISIRLATKTGDLFLKGLPTDHPRVWTQTREAAIGARVATIAPRVLWQTETAGWHLVAFEALDGHHADYRPDSPDLPHVAEALAWLSVKRAPEDVELKHAEHRLRDHAPATALAFFAGDALCHTDPNPTNVIVDHHRARIVDWAWATRGAPWLDAGYWVIWLIAEGGHTPASAEQWAARIPAYRDAPTVAVNAFATANDSVWAGIAQADPDPWTHRVHQATKAWAVHRTGVAR
ncbi:aminoglycoside phosphotransferase [Streptomyces longisporoflavus]|uniref:Aminoglycoside phosphotransferase n=1 Tax=Streptomyces longisporoflavus TaxID=28044 RepID=A0ABW7R3T8_9ACTN